jgi:hypothetical protein
MSHQRRETVPNNLEVPESSAVNRRITTFYRQLGFHSLQVSNEIRGVSVFPRGFGDVPGASLFYWIVDDKPATGWTYRYANDPALRSQWNMGDAKALDPSEDPEALLDAQIVLPTIDDVEQVYADVERRLPAHLLGEVQNGLDGEVYFDFLDPFFHRVAVTEAVLY